MQKSHCRAGASAALLALMVLATVTAPAEAQQRRHRQGGNGAGVAAGVIGGLAAGAILGGALGGPAAAGPGYGVDPAYGPEAVDDPDGYGGCPVVRQPVYDEAGRFAGYRPMPSC